MEKNTGSYKFEKRKKEIARQKKQEEKRRRHLEKKQEKLEGTESAPVDESSPQAQEGSETETI
jgi:hypothetical protein